MKGELRFLKTVSCHTPFLRKPLEEEVHQKEGVHKKGRHMLCWVRLHTTYDQVKMT